MAGTEYRGESPSSNRFHQSKTCFERLGMMTGTYRLHSVRLSSDDTEAKKPVDLFSFSVYRGDNEKLYGGTVKPNTDVQFKQTYGFNEAKPNSLQVTVHVRSYNKRLIKLFQNDEKKFVLSKKLEIPTATNENQPFEQTWTMALDVTNKTSSTSYKIEFVWTLEVQCTNSKVFQIMNKDFEKIKIDKTSDTRNIFDDFSLPNKSQFTDSTTSVLFASHHLSNPKDPSLYAIQIVHTNSPRFSGVKITKHDKLLALGKTIGLEQLPLSTMGDTNAKAMLVQCLDRDYSLIISSWKVCENGDRYIDFKYYNDLNQKPKTVIVSKSLTFELENSDGSLKALTNFVTGIYIYIVSF